MFHWSQDSNLLDPQWWTFCGFETGFDYCMLTRFEYAVPIQNKVSSSLPLWHMCCYVLTLQRWTLKIVSPNGEDKFKSKAHKEYVECLCQINKADGLHQNNPKRCIQALREKEQNWPSCESKRLEIFICDSDEIYSEPGHAYEEKTTSVSHPARYLLRIGRSIVISSDFPGIL